MKCRVLLVEDDRSVAYMLSKALVGAHFDVDLARDGPAAWRAFQERRPDVVLSDLRIPGMDGVELLRRIKKADPDLDVILLTGHGDLATAIRAVELGAYRYLEKPVGQMADLIQTLHEACQKRQLLRDRQLIDAISRDLSRGLSLDGLIGRFLERITAAFPQIDLAVFSFYRPGEDKLTIGYVAGPAASPTIVGARLDAAVSVSARAIDRRAPVYHDLRHIALAPPAEMEQGGMPASVVELIHAHPTLGAVAIPIISEEAPIAVLTVANLQSIDALNQGMIDLLATLCGQLGLSLRNLMLLAEREAEAGRLQAVLDSAADGVLVVDGDGLVILSNPRYRALLAPGGRLDCGAQRRLIKRLQLCLQTEERTQFVFTLSHPTSDEPTLLEVYGARVRQGDDAIGIVATLRDVTVLRTRERKRSELLRLARHEIGTPLSAIALQLRTLLNSRAIADEAARETLRAIIRESREVETMITETLGSSDVRELLLTRQQSRLNLSQLAGDLAQETAGLAARRALRFEADVAPDLWVMASYGLLKQALRNLLDNARKFTPAGGTISWRAWRDGATVRLAVSDTGVGIPADELDQIFEPYYRASSAKNVHGTGLGLSIVRDVIAVHRGKVEVTSTPGEGSTFTVTLAAVTGPS